jgi:hypothetical protein
MGHVFEVTDDAYQAIATVAARHGTSAEELFRAWVARALKEAQAPESAERDPDQAWFWTEEWQAGEREADADIAAGRVTRFHSDEDFLRSLGATDEFLRALDEDDADADI